MDGPEGGGGVVENFPEERHFGLDNVAEERDGEVSEGARDESKVSDVLEGELAEELVDDLMRKGVEGVARSL